MQITPTTIYVARRTILTTEYVIGNIITSKAEIKQTASNTNADVYVNLLSPILMLILPNLNSFLFLPTINTIKAKIGNANDIGYDA